MDYASFKLNLANIGLDTKLVDGVVIISSGKNQVGKVFLELRSLSKRESIRKSI